jgi:outer membrane protein OmpA-like peptidoglycan-associated protein
MLTTRGAAADPMRWHLELGGAHAVGEPQSHEYGPGAEGRLAIELGLGRAFGLQVEGGSLWLAHTNPPRDVSIADHGDGIAGFVMGGARVRPMFDVAGPWVDANVGYVRTGTRDRVGFDAHIGYDWRIGSGRWDVGPYVGYFQILQPGDALRPEDAHVVSVGIHIALGAERTPLSMVAADLPPGPPPIPQEPPSADRDGDGIADAQDACPDVPGPRSDDPKLNGCPPPAETVRVVENRIQYGETILFETNRAEVQQSALPLVEVLAKFINANPQIEEVEIIGNADERGTEDYNLRLSKARAEAVRGMLLGLGVQPRRLIAEGVGSHRPRAAGHTEDEWRQNRRVEFRIAKVRNGHGSSTTLPIGPQGGQP